MKFFQIYQYLAPLVLLPLSGWLWWLRFGNSQLVAVALSIPIVFAYVIPAIGTNWLRLWEFNTRFRLGRFRPHHGFVFGAATSLFGLLALPDLGPPDLSTASGAGESLRTGFLLGSVLAFWNWLYDALAIRAGFIVVYNRRYHEGAEAETIAGDYVPIFFGTFGFCYGAALRILEQRLAAGDGWQAAWGTIVACHLVCLVAPVAAYVLSSRLRHGDWGLHSYERKTHEV